MQKIKDLAEHIKEELCDAQHYAEDYIDKKVNGETSMASKYKEMATEELKHAGYLHDYVVEEIKKIQAAGVKPPAEMLDKWESEHRQYVDKAAWVKQMLTL